MKEQMKWCTGTGRLPAGMPNKQWCPSQGRHETAMSKYVHHGWWKDEGTAMDSFHAHNDSHFDGRRHLSKAVQDIDVRVAMNRPWSLLETPIPGNWYLRWQEGTQIDAAEDYLK